MSDKTPDQDAPRPDTTRQETVRQTEALTLPLRVGELAARGGLRFAVAPASEARAALAAELGVLRIRKLEFRGTLSAEGRHDWRLDAVLGATVVQACVITAEPVTTRIDQPVTRRFLRDMPESVGPEAEIPEDDTLEPLGPLIDPGAVMAEALALALPDYPRAPGAELPDSAAPDFDDARPNPFAALAALKRDSD